LMLVIARGSRWRRQPVGVLLVPVLPSAANSGGFECHGGHDDGTLPVSAAACLLPGITGSTRHISRRGTQARPAGRHLAVRVWRIWAVARGTPGPPPSDLLNVAKLVLDRQSYHGAPRSPGGRAARVGRHVRAPGRVPDVQRDHILATTQAIATTGRSTASAGRSTYLGADTHALCETAQAKAR